MKALKASDLRFILSLFFAVLIIALGTNGLIRLKKSAFIHIPGWIYRMKQMKTLPTQPVFWEEPSMLSQRSLREEFSAKPNVILIVADDLGVNDLNGGAGVATPNIDSIAANGVQFANAYSAQATCAPARAAIFTGRHPTKIGFEFTPVPIGLARVIGSFTGDAMHPPVWYRDKAMQVPPMAEMRIPQNVTTLGEEMRAQGYSTYLIGKWHLGHSSQYTPRSRGFDETLTFPAGFSLYLPADHPECVNAPLSGSYETFDKFLRYNLPYSVSFNDGPAFTPDEYLTDYLTHRATDLIHSRGDTSDPFFLSLTYTAPHNPLQAQRSDFDSPELSHITDHTARVYAAMIKSLDRGVGEVIEALRQTNQLDNTLIIFTSDNGAAHYLGIEGRNLPYRGWKGTFFEGGIRVPLFMQWPQVIPAGKQYSGIVGLVDIFATIRGTLKQWNKNRNPFNYPDFSEQTSQGVSFSSSDARENESDGQNLLYLMDESGFIPHSSFYWRSGHYKAYREGNWKLQLAERPDRVWLYNIAEDPTEQKNLAGVVGFDMHSRLREHYENRGKDLMRFCSQDISRNSTFGLELKLLRMYESLLLTDKDQSPPLWPAVFEGPIPIDKTGLQVMNRDDEFVYFAN